MSKKFNEVNTKLENSKQNINNNSINNPSIDKLIKNSISNQFIYFKEDILEEVKQLETQMVIKYKLNLSKNENKIIKMQENIEEIQKNLEKIASSVNKDNPLLERTDKLSDLIAKLEQTFYTKDIKIKNTTTKLAQDLYDLNNKITENIFNPLVIGSNGKYKTFHEFIDFIICNINNLLMFKEKIYSLHKELKNKTETNMNNFRTKLDYLSHNYINFISTSFKDIEQKTQNNLNETLNVEFEKINKNFENHKNNLEEKILNINQKLQKIDKLEQNFEKIESYMKKMDKINQESEKKLFKNIRKYFKDSKNISIIINQNKGNSKKDKLINKKSKSFEKYSLKSKDFNDNISEFIKGRKEIRTESNIEKLDEEGHSISEDSDIENDIELRKNKIKDKINNILFNNLKTYKELHKLKNEESKYISNFLQHLYPELIISSKNEKKLVAPKKDSNNINNKIKLIKNNKNIDINKHLFIANKKESVLKSGSIKLEDSMKENSKSLPLIKTNSQPKLNNANIKNNNEINDKDDLTSTLKNQRKENQLSLKYLIYNQKNENKMNESKEPNSLSFRKSSYDQQFLNSNKKIKNQKRKNTADFFMKQNPNNKLNKSLFNKIIMNFSDNKDNNKEKDELKMMKIFYDLKDVIQNDEKSLIKNRFINYGYKRDIIFVRDKRDAINRSDISKNDNFEFNNNGLKVRPHSKSFIRN